MAYRIELTERATRNLRHIHASINAEDSEQARNWFNGLENAVLGLGERPARGETIPEDLGLRHLLYGRKWHRYRIISAIDEDKRVVTVIHIRRGSRTPFNADNPDNDASY